jgi:hypothetical protein
MGGTSDAGMGVGLAGRANIVRCVPGPSLADSLQSGLSHPGLSARAPVMILDRNSRVCFRKAMPAGGLQKSPVHEVIYEHPRHEAIQEF